MKKIALIGRNGFVGAEIFDQFIGSKKYTIIPVLRGDSFEKAIGAADIVVHCANSAKRFYAENHAEGDFYESVEKTALIRGASKDKPFVLISSISARTQLNTVYGRHRRACELIADAERSLIVRLGAMYGARKIGGVLDDLVNHRTVYAASTSKYAFANVKYNAKKIASLIHEGSIGIVEIGAKNSISLASLRNQLGSRSKFEGEEDSQIPVSPPMDAPDAQAVVLYAQSMMQNAAD